MPIDASIRRYIDTTLVSPMDDELFTGHVEIAVLEIFRLLPARPEDARHTTAYLCYRLSFLYMRSQNEAVQAVCAQSLSRVLQRAYNHRTPLEAVDRAPARDSYPVLLLLYQVHYALVMNGLRSEAGPLQLDAFEPLRLLQSIVGAGYGPWHSQIRLQGAIRDYHHARLGTQGGSPLIEIGRAPREAPLRLHLATWNMQGSSQSQEAKWRTQVLNLVRANHIVAIQEAGSMPASAELVQRIDVQDQFGGFHVVEQYTWQAGTSTRPEHYQVFFFDVQRLRVNLAIVVHPSSELEVREVAVLSDGPVGPDSAPYYRPALGLRLRRLLATGPVPEMVTVFNFHAISGGGVNAPRMLREISWHTDTPYVLLGDFNRDPRPPGEAVAGSGNWISPPQIARIEPAASSTHPSTAPQTMLDYAVINGSTTPVAPGQVCQLCPSDHLSVSYVVQFI